MLSRDDDSRLDEVDSREDDEVVEDRLDGQRAGHDEVRFVHEGGWRTNDEAWVRIRFSRLGAVPCEKCRASILEFRSD